MLRMADRHEPCVRVKVKIQGVAMFVRMVCSSVWITMRNKGVVNMINLYCEVNGKIVGPSGIWTRIFGIPVRRSTNWAIEPNGEPSFNPFPPRDSPLTSKIVWRLTEWNNKGAVLSALGKERKGKERMAELRRTQIDVVTWKGILKAPSAAAIRQLTTDHSLGLGVDFTGGGKPENPEKNPRSTGETNYNTLLTCEI